MLRDTAIITDLRFKDEDLTQHDLLYSIDQKNLHFCYSGTKQLLLQEHAGLLFLNFAGN